MLQINLFLTLLCLWLFIYLNNKFLRVCRINKVRFQLFALRDSLAVLAMRGAVDQAGDEYKTLRHMINESIRVLDTFSIVSFLKYSIFLAEDKALQKRLDKIVTSLQQYGNKEFREIVFQYFKIMQSTFDSHTWFLMNIFLPLIILIMSPFVMTKRLFKQKADSLEAVDQYFEKRTNQLLAA